MPERVAEFMYQRLRTGGYGSISEYVRELVRLDERFELLRGNASHRKDNLPQVDQRWPPRY